MTVMLALNAGISLMLALERAVVGAILVYALVFVGLHMMARLTYHGNVKRNARKPAARKAERPAQPVHEGPRDDAQEKG